MHDPNPPGPLGRLLRHDLPASLVVFLIAVPLSLGIAVASGAPIMAGLIAGVVGGVLAGALGGSPLQVSGPAAGLTVVVAELVAQFGWAVTCAITVAAGLLQILFGMSRVARAALAISPTVVHAMLAGIGVTIALQQVHVLLGGEQLDGAWANLVGLPAAVGAADLAAVAVGGSVVVVLLLWPRLPVAVRRVPGPLVAVVGATVLAALAALPVQRIELPGNLVSSITPPTFPDGRWAAVVTGVLTIALIASVESLLSAVAVDKMHTGPRTDFDRELMGQGVANMASGALGGLPVTGVIVRSSANVAAGARTRASTVLHGCWILLFSVAFLGAIALVPFAALAGLLVMIGAQLVKVEHIRTAHRTGDLPVYAVTVLGVVFLNLLEGVLIGLALAVLLVLRRVVTTRMRTEQVGDPGARQWRVTVSGSVSFLALPRLTRVLAAVPPASHVTLDLEVDFLDHATFDAITAWTRQHEATGGTVAVDEAGSTGLAQADEGPPRRSTDHALIRGSAPWSTWQETDAPAGGTPPVLAGVADYHRRTADPLREHLTDLVDGQRPGTLFLTCADSRVVPNVITSSGPGDLLTLRNIGNIVPTAAGTQESSVDATVQYAVSVLGVGCLVVCGHSGCGAMGALHARQTPGSLGDWLAWGEPSVRAHAEGHPVGRAAAERGFSEVDQLAMVNVAVQVGNLERHPAARDAIAEGRAQAVGLFFDIASARVLQITADGITEPDAALAGTG